MLFTSIFFAWNEAEKSNRSKKIGQQTWMCSRTGCGIWFERLQLQERLWVISQWFFLFRIFLISFWCVYSKAHKSVKATTQPKKKSPIFTLRWFWSRAFCALWFSLRRQALQTQTLHTCVQQDESHSTLQRVEHGFDVDACPTCQEGGFYMCICG